MHPLMKCEGGLLLLCKAEDVAPTICYLFFCTLCCTCSWQINDDDDDDDDDDDAGKWLELTATTANAK